MRKRNSMELLVTLKTMTSNKNSHDPLVCQYNKVFLRAVELYMYKIQCFNLVFPYTLDYINAMMWQPSYCVLSDLIVLSCLKVIVIALAFALQFVSFYFAFGQNKILEWPKYSK